MSNNNAYSESPVQRHRGEDKEILANRDSVYKSAKEANPGRWSGSTHNWNPEGPVALNPEQIVRVEMKHAASLKNATTTLKNTD
ncbi:MAG: hypothetical protein KAG53_01370 [Endozoicomonadaceae bacterium]|nr:hypothetical protein [Endozoicomonadaceae bacterium]